MFKLFGACFLVVGGYFWGESIALKKKKRYQLLLDWWQILMDMEGEIRTMATPLPILLVEIGEKRKCEIGESLVQVGNRIQMREQLSFAEIWEEELKKGNFEVGKDELDRMIHQYEEQLKMQGLDIEKYFEFTGMTHEKLHEQMVRS